MINELYETIGFIIYSTTYQLDEEGKKKDKKLNKKVLKTIIKQLFKDNNLNASKIGNLTKELSETKLYKEEQASNHELLEKEIQQLKEENITLKTQHNKDVKLITAQAKLIKVKKMLIEHQEMKIVKQQLTFSKYVDKLKTKFDMKLKKSWKKPAQASEPVEDEEYGLYPHQKCKYINCNKMTYVDDDRCKYCKDRDYNEFCNNQN